MANMFSGNSEKKIQRDLKSCYATDPMTQNLWSWCERLEKWGLRICIILFFIGIVTVISEASETAKLLEKLDIEPSEIQTAMAEYGIEIKPVSQVVIEKSLLWAFYCFLEFCSYHILALLIGSLASIVQHTKITANVALYRAEMELQNMMPKNKKPNYPQAPPPADSKTTPINLSEIDTIFHHLPDISDDELQAYQKEKIKVIINNCIYGIAGVIVIILMIILFIKSR